MQEKLLSVGWMFCDSHLFVSHGVALGNQVASFPSWEQEALCPDIYWFSAWHIHISTDAKWLIIREQLSNPNVKPGTPSPHSANLSRWYNCFCFQWRKLRLGEVKCLAQDVLFLERHSLSSKSPDNPLPFEHLPSLLLALSFLEESAGVSCFQGMLAWSQKHLCQVTQSRMTQWLWGWARNAWCPLSQGDLASNGVSVCHLQSGSDYPVVWYWMELLS